MFLTKTILKKWIAVGGGPLYGGLNALLHIVIFTTHGRRNVVIFHIPFPVLKDFKENNYCTFFQTAFCLHTQRFLTLSLHDNRYYIPFTLTFN